MKKETIKEEVLQVFKDLYILYTYKYLLQDSSGVYCTKEYKKGIGNSRPILDFNIQDHLLGKKTLGVFASNFGFTKFICFDVDIIDKEFAKLATYILVETIQDLGINGEYIHISFSGNKGYHVEIFFNEPVYIEQAKKFYKFVLYHANLFNIPYGAIEFRPTDTQGVKLPLGCNFRNPNWQTHECWFVDYTKRLEPIKNHNYLFSIKKLDREFFYRLIFKFEDSLSFDEAMSESLQSTSLQYSIDKPLQEIKESFGFNDFTVINPISTLKIDELEKYGLSQRGTRHNALLKLAIHYRHIGLTQEQTESDLIEWMKEQDKKFYTSSWKEVIEDIELIVKYTYERGYSPKRNDNVEISQEEINEIIKIKGNNQKLLLFHMLIHSKKYANTNGVFYMTYSQMQEQTGLSDKTVKNLVNNISQSSEILEIVERNKGTFDKYKGGTKQPNKYKLNIALFESNCTNTKKFNICDKNCNDCFYKCIRFFLTDREIRKLFTRREYNHILNSCEQCYCNKYTNA